MEDASGLLFPHDLGAHITEMWSRPSLKPSARGGPGKLWQAYFDRFCSLAIIPSEEELRQRQMELKVFRERSARMNLKVQAEFLQSKVRHAGVKV